jgi:hypothetical protein
VLWFSRLFGSAPAAETSHAQADQQGQEGQPEKAPHDEEGPKAPAEVRIKAPAKVKTAAWAEARTTAWTETSAKRQASRDFNHSPVGHPVSIVVHQAHLPFDTLRTPQLGRCLIRCPFMRSGLPAVLVDPVPEGYCAPDGQGDSGDDYSGDNHSDCHLSLF